MKNYASVKWILKTLFGHQSPVDQQLDDSIGKPWWVLSNFLLFCLQNVTLVASRDERRRPVLRKRIHFSHSCFLYVFLKLRTSSIILEETKICLQYNQLAIKRKNFQVSSLATLCGYIITVKWLGCMGKKWSSLRKSSEIWFSKS